MTKVMLVALVVPGMLGAQQVAGDAPRARVLVAEFAGPGLPNAGGAVASAALGEGLARETRKRLGARGAALGFDVVPERDMTATLAASGYPRTGAFALRDEAALATLLRAGEVVSGSVMQQGEQFVVRASLGLSRDVTLVQPLPVFRAGSLADAADSLVTAVVAARRQLAGAAACASAVKEGRHAEGAAAARTGIAAYPAATIARMCLVSAYSENPADRERAAAVAREIVAIDPDGLPALALMRQRFEQQGAADSVRVYDARLRQRVAGRPSHP